MDSERVLAGQTVIVRGGTVAEVGPIDGVAIPAEATVIYGRGRYLVPGLVDMHVHVRAEDLPRYIENGVTTVRDLARSGDRPLTRCVLSNGLSAVAGRPESPALQKEPGFGVGSPPWSGGLLARRPVHSSAG